jgi:hypothetical protein
MIGPLATRFLQRPGIRPAVLLAAAFLSQAAWSNPALAAAYDFFRWSTPNTTFAVDPDFIIRRIDPRASDQCWALGEGWGLPPLFSHTKVGDSYERVDFFYPLGAHEEAPLQSRLRFTPFFESRWSKIAPFDGYSRCLTFFEGRSDLGQDYWGIFPFYGYTFRRYGVDENFFVLFPLYYWSRDDNALTHRVLWPLVTYADSPGRSALKVWPLFGKDAIRDEYFNWFLLWPFFQHTERHPGTAQAFHYTAMPFPLYVREDTAYHTATHYLWPLVTVYKHHRSGHRKYTVRPFFTYGSGGGVEELSILYVYSSKKDHRKGTEEKGSDPYVTVNRDEVVTEREFLYLSSIRKKYRKGRLVSARYKLWPLAEYSWDREEGTHLTVPILVTLSSDFWDRNLGRLLSFVDYRETPITKELSLLFGLSQRTEMKPAPCIPAPPKSGEDDWEELFLGSFGKQ